MTDSSDPFSLDDAALLAEVRKDFLNEAGFLLEEYEAALLKLDDPGSRDEELKKIYRTLHTLKGGGATVGMDDLSKFAHELENLLSALRADPSLVTAEVSTLLLSSCDAFKRRIQLESSSPATATQDWDVAALRAKAQELMPASAKAKQEEKKASAAAFEEELQKMEAAAQERTARPTPELSVPRAPLPQAAQERAAPAASQKTTIRVERDRIDAVLNLVEELIVIKSQLMHHDAFSNGRDQRLNSMVDLLDKTVRELQDRTLTMRTTSLQPLFQRIQRTVRDLSVKLGKPVDVEISGEDTEIDRAMIETLADPLLHLARNAIDHGVETAEARCAAGKPERGRISLSARQSNGMVVIELRDDGAGIRKDKVLAHARKNGIIPPEADASKFSSQQIHNFLFQPGFSTADKVTDVSGRGVGLDVVKSGIERIRGSVEIDSREGEGTCFRLILPLTIAIIDGIRILVRGVPYIVPIAAVREILSLQNVEKTRLLDGSETIQIRGKSVQLLDLAEILPIGSDRGAFADFPIERVRPTAVVVEHRGGHYALYSDGVLGQGQFVVKSLGDGGSAIPGIGGGAILADGRISLVLDPPALIKSTSERDRREKAA